MENHSHAEIVGVYRHLVFSKSKKIPLHALERNFPTINDLKNVLLQHSSLFWLGEVQSNVWEVKPKVKVQFCLHYQEGTCRGQCDKLHLCRDNLLSPEFCRAPCKYQRSHSIDDNHNRKVLQAIFPKGFRDDGGKAKILRTSFPRLCKSFTESGSCTKSCGYLHICPEFIRGSCVDDCMQAILSELSKKTTHNFEIEHNKTVLKSFNLSTSKVDRPELLGNILINATKQTSKNENGIFAQLHAESLNDIVNQRPSDNKSVKRRSMTKSTSSISLNNNANAYTTKVSISNCHYYLNEKCKNKNCPRLHICKEYLAGACKISECPFGLSHDLLDDHNKPITEKIKACHSKKIALQVVRSHLPQLCENYAVTGNCQWRDRCSGVHICKEFLRNSLCTQDKCTKSHKLFDKHNEGIANKHSSLSELKGPKGQKIDYFKADIIFSKFDEKNRSSVTEIENKGYVSQSYETVTKSPSETSVFSFILNNGVEGAIHLDDLLSKLFENDEERALSWFHENSKSFRITHDATTMKKSIHLCLENVAPCCNYWTEIGCNVSSCKMFHICKKFLHGIPHSEISCKYDHNVDGLVKSELASEHNLRSLSSDHLLLLLKSRLPFVCKYNLAGKCDSPDGTCPDIHICGDFIAGKCKKADGLCSHKHESALATKHSVDVMTSYHIPQEDYLKCLVYIEERTKQSVTNETESKAQFNSLKEEAICYRYINDDCMEGSSCKLLHPDPRFPFLWQYHEMEMWTNFPASISTELEKFFCDPNNGDNFSLPKEAVLTVDFSGNAAPWKGRYHNNQVDIRRLSTMSSVHAKDDSVVGLTQWKWYWKSDNGWDEYSETNQLHFEKFFLKDDITGCELQIKHHHYRLDFKTMKQQNLGPKYFTKRNVRRRPKFQCLDDIRKSKGVQDDQLPSHWPKTFEDGARISIVNKNVEKRLREDFLKSINEDVTIVSVTEICNDVHYRKYVNSKSEFAKRLGESNIREMILFHGTSAASIEGICKQNFDWRLNGMQGVAYGKGSYFARDASYSNKYAKPDVNGHRFMFIAQVLAGNYTTGNSSMSRPPEDTSSGPHRLFDSCVNNVSDPSIYVIFERSQVYPRYLITYQKKSSQVTHPGLMVKYRNPVVSTPSSINDLKVGMKVKTPLSRGTTKTAVEFTPSSMNDLKVDMKVKTSYGIGTIKWLNPHPLFLTKKTDIGIEFETPVGYTDGLHVGYDLYLFICQPNHGAYVKFTDLLCAYK